MARLCGGPRRRFLLLTAVLLPAAPADARVTRLEVAREAPAFGGVVFGAVGAYELIEAVARGRVEYAADVVILKPADLARGNGLLLFELPNRGARSARPSTFGRGVPSDRDLEEPDGGAITGLVRAEFVVAAPTRELPLSAGWFTGGRHAPYPTARVDHRAPFPDGFRPVLTVRTFETDPRVEVPPDQWAFASYPNGGPPIPAERSICLKPGFEPGRIYEVVYRAKDPLVLGLGYAAIRDPVVFLTHEATDDTGRSNPLHRPGRPLVALGHGVSQGARALRSFLHLGFNRDEPAVACSGGSCCSSGRVGLRSTSASVSPGAPGAIRWTGSTRATSSRSPMRGRRTGPAGLVDLAEPPEVRTYLLAGTQHGPASDPSDFGDCLYPRNPAPHRETMRALLAALAHWVVDGVPPPASRAPRIADATLVPANQVRFPRIPVVRYGDLVIPGIPAVPAPLGQPRLDFGPLFRPYDLAGILTLEPPRVAETGAYRILVPQVDAGGNDLAGVQPPTIAAPLGTYTGWNLGRAGRWPGRFCTLQSSFVPFASTREERIAAGDPRLSLEERYGDEAGHRSRFRAVIERLVAERLLLAEDAAWLADQAPWRRAEQPRRSSARTGE